MKRNKSNDIAEEIESVQRKRAKTAGETGRKSFNDVLKAKEAQRRLEAEKNNDGHIALDDAKRIKVLSPGQLVFKRFIRNKLAIFGVCVLLAMFLFSFVAPIFYAYGETNTFYKYDLQSNQYAVATVRTEYSNYTIDDSVEIDSFIKRNITSAINTLENSGEHVTLIEGETGETFLLNGLGEKIYVLSTNDGGMVATWAANQMVATYYVNSDSFQFTENELGAAFEAAVKAAIANGEQEITVDGVRYNVTKQSKIEYTVGMADHTIAYTGEKLGEAFETALAKSIEDGKQSFTAGGITYVTRTNRGTTTVFSAKEGKHVLVSSAMAYSGSVKATPEFLAKMYYAVYGTGSFDFEGETYTFEDLGNSTFEIHDSQGEEIGLLSDFVVMDADGNNTISIENKEAIQQVVLEMMKTGETGLHLSAAAQADAETAPEGPEGIPVGLTFVKRVSYFDGTEPHLDIVYGENGEPEDDILTGRIVRKNDYYYVTCGQWKYLIDNNGAPSTRHLLGTDPDGYDVLARMMYGGRISLLVGFVVVILETFLGVIMGGIAGYFGGWVDNLIMRLVDIFYCIPSMPILIIMGAFMDDQGLDPIPRLMWMMVILGVLGWASVARLVRGQILSLREQEFMVATEATGVKVSRRIFRHLIPNVMPQLIVSATAGLGGVILTESTLSFLGLGVKRPMATWGTIISSVTSSNENILNYTYIWIPVGLLICLTVIAFNFVGDGLRDAFDPKMKR